MSEPAFSLAGRTVFVAGASSGIGVDVARTFARAGARLVLGARRLDRVQALAGEIGGDAMGVAMDVSDEASVIAAFDAAEARFGTVESVLANAGIGTGGRTTDTVEGPFATVEDLAAVIEWRVKTESTPRPAA